MTSAVGENICKDHNRNQAERIFINSSFICFHYQIKKKISNTVKKDNMKFSGLKKKKKKNFMKSTNVNK